MNTQISTGYCQCGCGQKTKIAIANRPTHGHIKGIPMQFVVGHRTQKPIIDRFWGNVEKTHTCWNWIGGISKSGYGVFTIHHKSISAHRYSWELHNDRIPKGMYVLHKCDNRICVNPSHLFIGTQSENIRDMVAKGRNSQATRALSNNNLKKVVEMRKHGFTLSSIANLFGVSIPTIHKWTKRIIG